MDDEENNDELNPFSTPDSFDSEDNPWGADSMEDVVSDGYDPEDNPFLEEIVNQMGEMDVEEFEIDIEEGQVDPLTQQDVNYFTSNYLQGSQESPSVRDILSLMGENVDWHYVLKRTGMSVGLGLVLKRIFLRLGFTEYQTGYYTATIVRSVSQWYDERELSDE